jgi:sarcosine oxidase subunit beta
MEKNNCDSIVVGGGIIGCALAYYLSKKKHHVVLLEKNFPAAGASGACNGGLSYLGKKGQLLDQAIESLYLYKELDKELQVKLEKDQNRKILFLAENEKEMEFIDELVQECNNRNMDANLKSCNEVKKILPIISGPFLGGAIAGGGLHGIVNPFNIINGFLQKFKTNGGKLFKNQEVKEILVQNCMIFGVKTESFELKSSTVIICAGYETNELLKPLKFDCCLIPSKGTVLITEKSFIDMNINILSAGFLEENEKSSINLAIEKTLHNNILIGTSAELGKTDLEIESEIVFKIAKKATDRFPILKTTNLIRTFSGIRPVRTDGPFMGVIPGIQGLFAAFGHGGMGITLAPYVGKMVANLIN